MNYKYISARVVAKIDDDGISRMSCSVEHPDFVAWVAEGNTPEPADPPPPPTQDELDAEAARQYAKLQALRSMTPAQVGAWVDANVNNLADAKDACPGDAASFA